VAKYLPPSVKVPTYKEKRITLLNLAVQDSGLPFNADNHAEGTWLEGFNAYTAKDMYAFLSHHRLEVEPGTAFRYSNLGMGLLGHALERGAGEDFESLVVSRICDPLDMNDTRITLSEDMKSRLAVGHSSSGERTPYYDFKVMQPTGSLCSTANDMLKYVSAQLGLTQTKLTPLMEQTHVQRHESSGTSNTAMPWTDDGVYLPSKSRFLGHGGGTVGFSAFIGFDTQRRRGVVVLTNQKKEKSNQRIWHGICVGWSVLQQLPLNMEHASQLVREIVGIGSALDTDKETGLIKIQAVYPKSPAWRAGLKAGQLIQTINGVSVKGRSLAKCIELMQGPAGTIIQLEIKYADNKTKVVELTKGKFLTSKS
jgi:CubicO group peptidase (beta-lactamase class C family)